uniref:HXK3 n=1 Tax=Arundo donax TaxID=35708 RepID=A0A0A9DGV5_ARUDO
MFPVQHTITGCNSRGRFTRSERSQKDTARTSEDTRHASENSKACRQSLRHRHPESCPTSCCWDHRDTEKARPGWEWCGFKRKNARPAEADGGGDRGWSIPGLSSVQGVPRRSFGGDPGGGGGADGEAEGDGGWVGDRSCPPGRRTFVE